MIETTGYSIWLEPEGDIKTRLARVIKELSLQHNTAIFDPHVTLLGGIQGFEKDVLDLTNETAQRIKSYIINLTGKIYCEEHWAKSLFVQVRKTAELLKANQIAREVFDLNTLDVYHPHLSLMYSEDIPLDKRIEIARHLDAVILTGQFIVDKIHLYHTQGKVEDWEKVGEFKLTASH